jgi:hypothetical protein
MSEPGRNENFNQSPEALSRADLAKSMDSFSERMFKAGANILRFGAGAGTAVGEILIPNSLWFIKLGAIANGILLHEVGRRNPNSKLSFLAQRLGEGMWKGGAFGLASSIVMDTVIEPQARFVTGVGELSVPSSVDSFVSQWPEDGGLKESVVQGGEPVLKIVKEMANKQVSFSERLAEAAGHLFSGEKANEVLAKLSDIKLDPIGGINRIGQTITKKPSLAVDIIHNFGGDDTITKIEKLGEGVILETKKIIEKPDWIIKAKP